jgi:hypothetical protein
MTENVPPSICQKMINVLCSSLKNCQMSLWHWKSKSVYKIAVYAKDPFEAPPTPNRIQKPVVTYDIHSKLLLKSSVSRFVYSITKCSFFI